jgi:hypothetical protein
MAYDYEVYFKDTASVVSIGGVIFDMALTDGVLFGVYPFHRRPTSEHDIFFKGIVKRYYYYSLAKTFGFKALPITGNFKALPITGNFKAIRKSFITEAL